MCSYASSSFQDQLTVPIPFGIGYFTPIVATPLEMMGSILSVNTSSSEQMWELVELSTMTDDPSDSNPTCSENYHLEDSMWHILYYEIVQKKMICFCVSFGMFLSCLPKKNTWIWVIPPGSYFFFQIHLFAPLSNCTWLWLSWIDYKK